MTDYGLLSLLPIVLAIGLALKTRQIILSLGVGVFSASLILKGWNPWEAVVYTVDPLILDAIADRDHVKVTLFTFLSQRPSKSSARGAARALVDRITRWARSRRSGMLATWGAGMVVFFDDYANCLIVGGSMRSVCDRLKTSREAGVLVDSTAAPMATLALVAPGSPRVSLKDALKAAGQDQGAYAFFLEGLPYRFYPSLR